jgi:hypothetical protein
VAEQIVGRRQVEVELADERRIERDRLELDDDEAAKLQVIEEEVEVEVLFANLQVDPAADEREAGAQLEEEPLDVVDEGLLDLALAPGIGGAEEVEQVGSLKICSAMSESAGGSVLANVLTVLPCRACARFSIWRTRMSRDQPCSRARRAYHARVPTSSRRSSSARFWRQGNRATVRCTKSRSGQAAAKARIYLRLRGEKPCMSG